MGSPLFAGLAIARGPRLPNEAFAAYTSLTTTAPNVRFGWKADIARVRLGPKAVQDEQSVARADGYGVDPKIASEADVTEILGVFEYVPPEEYLRGCWRRANQHQSLSGSKL